VTLSSKPGGETAAAATPDRDTLTSELIDEMTSWSPRERMLAFRSWLKGSLSLIHLHVLTVLEADGSIAMSRLAENLDVSVASATGIIGRMEERGLVIRRHGEADRRVVLVEPTEAGIAIFRDLTEHRRQHLTAVLARLTNDELAALLTGLRAMRTARLALHAEKLASGLTAVTVEPAVKALRGAAAAAAGDPPSPAATATGDDA